jgi:hypothetical protein
MPSEKLSKAEYYKRISTAVTNLLAEGLFLRGGLDEQVSDIGIKEKLLTNRVQQTGTHK